MTRLLLGSLALTLVGCTSVSPDAGHEAVLVRKPIIFGHGGVDVPVKPGRKYVAWTTFAIHVNMQPARVDAELRTS